MRFKFFVACIMLQVLCFFTFSSGMNVVGWKAHVVKVADGDTVTVVFSDAKPDFCKDRERVRLIGINSTEMNFGKKMSPEAYAQEAKDYAEKYLLDKDVVLSFDSISDTKDRYGRLLCYVWVNGKLFNEMIVREGLAYYYNKFQFDGKYMMLLNSAQRSAKFDRLNLWSKEKY